MTSPLEEFGHPLVFKTDGAFDAPTPRLAQAQRTRIRALDGMQKEALVTSTVSGDTWRLACDEGPYLDGDDVAPPPLGFMTTGLITSYMDAVCTLADRRDISIEDITLIQDSFYTMSGSALRGDMTGGALPIELEAQIEADADAATLDNLVETAVELAPAHGIVAGEIEGRFNLVCNGREISPDGVPEIDAPALPDPNEAFERRSRGEAPLNDPIINRTGRTAEPPEDADEKYTSEEGSSLADEQDRVLHLRGICTLRDDGVKKVVQKSFSPQATVFEFLSEEPEAYGGQGRAPDSATYLAAGIGLCFMTQLGRYAGIVGKDLSDYRIVQDTHFSAGGNKIGPDPGRADPAETHVFLDTDDGEEFARDALDMGEQTCFLHALCRTDLETNVEVHTD